MDVCSCNIDCSRLRLLIKELKEENKKLQQEIKRLKFEAEVHEENAMELNEIVKERKPLIPPSLGSLLQSPYPDSSFWLGVSDPLKLVAEWESSSGISSLPLGQRPSRTDFFEFLFWLRQGWTYKYLRFLRGTPESTARARFSKMIDLLQVRVLIFDFLFQQP